MAFGAPALEELSWSTSEDREEVPGPRWGHSKIQRTERRAGIAKECAKALPGRRENQEWVISWKPSEKSVF